MIELPILVLLALAAFRLTRLIVIDTIFDGWRDAFDRFLIRRSNLVINKLHELFNCTWCTGVWVSAGVYFIYAREFHFLNVAAIAGLQGLLHAFEPSE